MTNDKRFAAIVAAMLFGTGGWIEMRCAIARLETSVLATDHRVERIEHELDTRSLSARE